MKKKSKLLEFIDFDFDIHSKRENGVYMINDFYIGESSDIYYRILNHVQRAINGNGHNYDLCLMIRSIINSNNKIKVTLLSKNRWDERYFYNKYISEGYNLLNKGTTNYKYSSNGI